MIRIVAVIALITVMPVRAQQGPMLDAGPVRERVDPANLDPTVRAAAQALDRLREGQPGTREDWITICMACGLNPSIKGYASEVKPFPQALLVDLLKHDRLAVRMGALEMLENKVRDDFGFDPWQPEGAKNEAALRRWQDWASGDKRADKPKDETTSHLDDAKLRGYLVDLVADDVARQGRAYDALSLHGMVAVAKLEEYLRDTPQLTPLVRARIKEAQYRLVLHEALPKHAASVAHQLVTGTRDQKLEAMLKLPAAHEKAVPILAEYLADSDALIREGAMDALLLAAQEKAYPLVHERLKVETDENVIHAVLRRVSTKTSEGADLIANFIQSPNEDLAVAALNALSDGKSGAARDKLKPCLEDARWRVRVAALEYAGKADALSQSEAVMKAFDDKDEFVRYAAMKAAADMDLKSAVTKIVNMALADDSMLGPATEAVVRMGVMLPDALVQVLPSKPGDALLPVLRSFAEHAGHDGHQIELSTLTQPEQSYDRDNRSRAEQALTIIRQLVKHRDPDVKATALSLLCKVLMKEGDKQMVFDELKSADTAGRINILSSMRPGPFDFRESQSAEASGTKDVFEQLLAEPAPRNPTLEKVYESLGVKLEPRPESAASTAKVSGRTWAPMEREFYDLLVTLMDQDEDADLAYLAAMHLALGGNERAIGRVRSLLPSLQPHDHAQLARLLSRATYLTNSASGMDLLRALMRNESPEVRTDAAEAMLRKSTPDRLKVLLEEIASPDGRMLASDIYGYTLSNATESANASPTIIQWSQKVLADAKAKPRARVLALTLLGTTSGSAGLPMVRDALMGPDPLQRRAAWRSFMRLDSNDFETEVKKIANDPSSKVREVVAAAFKRGSDDSWLVWFGERESERESVPYRRRRNVFTLPEGTEAILRQLAEDTDAEVRAQAMLTLASHRRPIDPLKMHETFAALDDENVRRRLLESYLDHNFTQLDSRFSFLLNMVKSEWFSNWDALVRALRPPQVSNSSKALTSFASLLKDDAKASASKAKSVAKPESNTPSTPVKPTEPLRVLVFYKPGCKDCERTHDMLRSVAEAVPLHIEESNIETSEGARQNEVLCQRFKVEPSLHQVTPAVFMQGGALIKTQINFGSLQRLVERTTEQPVDASWSNLDEREMQQANAVITERFESFSLLWVIMAGLLDGINPCAFATIIFFLSYLRIARRSPREILLVGGAFITAVFLAYFLVGLGLSHVIAKLQAFAWVRVWLNRALGLVALLLAWLSLRDGWRALRGDLSEMTLQLPEFLKTRIRGVIREQSRSTHFIIAAFMSGVIISFLELACTGQVYLPTIIYMLRQGSMSALGSLVAYNLAFVLPLVIIFLLAYGGMTNEAMIRFQKKHTALVCFATAALFLALWVVLLLV